MKTLKTIGRVLAVIVGTLSFCGAIYLGHKGSHEAEAAFLYLTIICMFAAEKDEK